MEAAEWLKQLCDPMTEEPLVQEDSWLFGSDDAFFPLMCRTPIVRPHVDQFLQEEAEAIARAVAEFGWCDEVRQWFLARFDLFHAQDASPIDTELRGEGYPGYWNAVTKPEFLNQLGLEQPENLILDAIGKNRLGLGLELGCGQGGMIQMMSARCERVFGLESQFYLAAVANHLLPADHITTRFFSPMDGHRQVSWEKPPVDNALVLCGDLAAPPFCEPLFDWIHCGHVLDLIEDPTGAVVSIKRLLKPGGYLSLCTPWDFHEAGHFDGMLEILAGDFNAILSLDGIPWLRYQHARRFVLHEDWVWVGRLK